MMNLAGVARACLRIGVAGVLFPLLLLLTGCASIAHKQTVGDTGEAQWAQPRHIVIFLDGTNNDEASDTNVKRLHSLVSLQRNSNLFTLYVEGVGTGSDVAGMATGVGIGERVRIAYAFLLKHYRPGDHVYLFGFSRGAYSARMLNSLLYHAGLPAKPRRLTHAEFAERVYNLVKVESDYPLQYEPMRRQRVQERLSQLYANEPARSDSPSASVPALLPAAKVEVAVLGLWDSVEALGIPDWGSRLRHKAQVEQHVANVDNGNSRYGDKLCNVKRAFHAMSIDDNREWIFTPLLLTRKHLFTGCAYGDTSPLLMADGKINPKLLQEVWFAGAHSDVGGGYPDARLSGISLNWMIRRLREANVELVPAGVQVPEDPFGTSHNPEGGAFSPIYHAINRDLVAYVRGDTSLVDHLMVHKSVFVRRRYVPVRHHENQQLRLVRPGRACLVEARPALNSLDARGRLIEKEKEVDPLLPCPQETAGELLILVAEDEEWKE